MLARESSSLLMYIMFISYIIHVLCMLVLYSYVEEFMPLNGMILFELSRRWSKDITVCHACMHAVMYNEQETLKLITSCNTSLIV